MDNTIEDTKSIPADIATSGKVKMSRRDIMKHIGELFILRININLQGSVLDSPELMWAVGHPSVDMRGTGNSEKLRFICAGTPT